MHKQLLTSLLLGLFCAPLLAAGMGSDDPLIGMLRIDQLELRHADDATALAWKADAWIGKDLSKLWFKSEGEREDGEFHELETQLLYSHAISPHWDLQAGWRRDIHPTPKRDWLAIGVKGLAPYWFDIDATLFIGDEGQGAARLDAEYEYMFSQRLVLTPEMEMNLYTRDDPAIGRGNGLSDLSLGLRLSYAMRREFAPYVGMHWTGLYGQSADYARADGDDTRQLAWVAGVRMWF